MRPLTASRDFGPASASGASNGALHAQKIRAASAAAMQATPKSAGPGHADTPQGKAAPKTGGLRGMKRPTARPDPAPSRWAYRLQRVLLTPAYRLALRITVPFVLSMALMGGYLSDETRRDDLMARLYGLRDTIYKRPEFQISLLAIEGAAPTTQDDIREVMQLDLPSSTFDLDLNALREMVEDLPSVANAALRVRQKGVLEVTVSERSPAMLWRNREGVAVVDAEGVVISDVASRTDRPDLPLIAGAGANEQVPQAMSLWAIAAPLGDRLRGLVRIGERRWDVVLTNDLRIQLPTDNPELALERVIALHRVQDVLNRDLNAVDMRLAGRPTLRMNPDAVKRWWQIKDLVVETGGE
jgi:cell division protein FtsQ